MESERRINWLSLFIKIVIVFIFALIIIWLISKIVSNNKTSETFTNNINNMEKVSIEYFKTIDLPLEKGQSVKITLGELIEKELIVSIGSDSENTCDTNKSYSKITREKNNYLVETTLKCGKEKDTIKTKFSLEDCKNCNQSTKKEDEDTGNTENTNSEENKKTGITYYEHVKETKSYTRWASGSLTGENIENKYQYYSIGYDTYYTIGAIPSNKKSITYTVKLNSVPNKKYYFTTIEETEAYNESEESNYINEKEVSLYKGRKIKLPSNITKHSLEESNFTYKLSPYYREGEYYVRITVTINNTSGVETYYNESTKEKVYLAPIKIKVKFASYEILDTKPATGEYETISYYRYVTTNKETIWSEYDYVEGYTKTGNTEIR